MDLSDTGTLVTLISGLTILTGILGVIVPVLPGLVLCWLGVLIWAVFGDGGWGRWLVLAVVTAVAVGGTVVKYTWPGRDLKRAGVPNSSLVAGGVLGIVGFFVVPVIGLVLGFVLGLWIAERVRLGDSGQAWPATVRAVKAVGLALAIELTAAVTIGGLWGFGLFVA